MNRLLLVPLVAGLFTAAASAGAQSADAIPPVQPPPAMEDASPPPATAHTQMKVDPKTIPLANSDAEAAAAAADARERAATPLSALPPEPQKSFDSPGLPPDVQRAAEATELPVITVRQEGNTTIREYRRRGKLFAQYVVPKDGGDSKWYVDKRYEGPMPPDPAAGVSGHVTPVEYKLFEWSKP
ncbi:MAG: DUF2782 domain-containing protein [Rudaea sp.]